MEPGPEAAIEGFVEQITARRIAGWVRRLGAGHELTVDILAGGQLIGQTVAGRFRKDLLDSGKGAGTHAFDFEFATPIAEFGQRGFVQARVHGTDRVLAATAMLQSRLADPPAAPPAAAPLDPAPAPAHAAAPGRVHAIQLDGALMLAAATLQDGRVMVLVMVDGAAIGEAAATGIPGAPTPDLQRLGFSIALPAKLLDGAEHRVAMFDAATGQRLADGTRALSFARLAPSPPVSALPAEPPSHAAQKTSDPPDPDARSTMLARLCRHTGHADIAIVTTGPDQSVLVFPAASHASPLAVAAAGLVPAAAELAARITCRAVIVSPPTLDTLLTGALIREANLCPLLADIADIADPAEPAAACQNLLAEADLIIAATLALQHRHGGIMVRPSRDEHVFDPSRYDRAALRAEFGLGRDDRVILADGAAHRLPEIIVIAEALERVADRRLAVCIIGPIDSLEADAGLAAATQARLTVHPEVPPHRWPELLAMADALLALPESRVSARLIDAVAMGVPIFAGPAPALDDLAASGALRRVERPDQLDAALRSILHSSPPPHRGVFLADHSDRVNGARLAFALEHAAARRADPLPHTEALFRNLQQQTGTRLPFIGPHGRRRPARRLRDQPPDLVFLAPGNESDLYGTRADMLARHLLGSGKVRRIFHFDAPLSATALNAHAAASDPMLARRGSLLYASTVRRALGVADGPNILRRTFLHRSGNKAERLMGRDLPPRAAYPDFIRKTLHDAAVGPAPWLWVCAPATTHDPATYDEVRQAAEFAAIIADLGDQAPDAPDARLLADADLVLCATQRQCAGLAALRPDALLIADGIDLSPIPDSPSAAAELAALARPLIGILCGPLDASSIALVTAIAEQRPEATLLLTGPDSLPLDLASLRVVHWLGYRPEAEFRVLFAACDAAILLTQASHLAPALSACVAAQVPLITLHPGEPGTLAACARLVASPPELPEALAQTLATRAPPADPATRAALSWDSRIEEIWRHLQPRLPHVPGLSHVNAADHMIGAGQRIRHS